MEIFLIILAFLFLLIGLLGSIVPGIPGPPLSFAGLLFLQWSGRVDFGVFFLIVLAVITIAITIMDYTLPAWMTKRFGGSRLAAIGSILGLIVGMIFFPPIGILIGSFLGALAGELINNRIQSKNIEDDSAGGAKALKAALGAFLAFILGTGIKLIFSSIMIFYAVRTLIRALIS